MALPIGEIQTSNITPDPTYGIGAWSFGDFDRAVRYGVSRRDHSLYPAMPYVAYARLSRDDTEALYAYFTQGVAPARLPTPHNRIAFPLSLRFPLTIWRWLFAQRPEAIGPTLGQDPLIGRGAYIVEGPGHCGDCHTPRGAALQVKARSAAEGPAFLSGATVDGWSAPSLRAAGPGGIGDWSAEEIGQFLLQGHNAHGSAFGAMTPAIEHGTGHLTVDDALAVGVYLKTLPGPAARGFTYDATEARRVKVGDVSTPGAQAYLDNCAACHRPDGRGYEGVFPPLAGNPAVVDDNPLSVARIALGGARTAVTSRTPAQFTMPGFADRLDDQEMAQLLTYVRTSWGNHAAPVSRAKVADVRRTLARK
jgi:mono/diheme cytochrome c family protein